jgi:hypothetical protein
MKKNLLNNHRARRADVYMKYFLCNVYSSSFNSWSSGVGRGHNSGKHLHVFILKKKKTSPDPTGQIQSNMAQISLG